MTNRKRAVCGPAAAILLIAVVGCGRRPELAMVEGMVLLDGRPLESGSLAFESPGSRPASARIETGRILEPTTYRVGDGVPIGPQAIAVFAREASPPSVVTEPGEGQFSPGSMSGRSLIPRKYNDPATSGLSATIEPGRNRVLLTLTSESP